VIVGLLACAAATAAFLARSIEITNHVVVIAAAFAPYLMLGAPLAAAVFLIGKRWIWAGIASALTVAALVTQLPDDPSAIKGTGNVEVRVMTANLFLDNADPNSVVTSARDQADIVSVQELTTQQMGRLSAAGMDTSFPYRLTTPTMNGSDGAGLWSRYPLQEITEDETYRLSPIVARIQVPGVLSAPIFAVVHPEVPWPSPINEWRDHLARLAAILQQTAQSAGRGAVIVAGDFNSTRDMLQFRRLLREGYQDADERAVMGFVPTFIPTFHADSWLPPMLGIDHVLTRGCSASSVHTVTMVGSRHRALVATVQIPRSPHG
jgi:endonuclease/exonuclease/phosphatase (EEP) superfamily protein YafD